jgi:hypothetical protein
MATTPQKRHQVGPKQPADLGFWEFEAKLF